MTFEDRHEQLFKKISRTGCLMALFVHAGKVRLIQVTDKEANKILATESMKVIGFYDADCKSSWLMDDLIWADKHGYGRYVSAAPV